MRRCCPRPLRPSRCDSVDAQFELPTAHRHKLLAPGKKKKKKEKKQLGAHNDNRASLAPGEFAAYRISLPSSVLLVSPGGPTASPTAQSAQFSIPDSHCVIPPDGVSRSYLASDQSPSRNVFSQSLPFSFGFTKCDGKHGAKTEERVSRRCGSEGLGGGTQQRCCQANQNVKLKASNSRYWGASAIVTQKFKQQKKKLKKKRE